MGQFEKVCAGLERCEKDIKLCIGETTCEYDRFFPHCWTTLAHDALTLIRQQQERIAELEAAQTARVMTLEELSDWTHINPRERKPIYWENRCEQHESQWMLEMKNLLYMLEAIKKKVGRFWTSRPTDEQRKAARWDATD